MVNYLILLRTHKVILKRSMQPQMPGQKRYFLTKLYHIVIYLYPALTQKEFEVANNKDNRCSSHL